MGEIRFFFRPQTFKAGIDETGFSPNCDPDLERSFDRSTEKGKPVVDAAIRPFDSSGLPFFNGTSDGNLYRTFAGSGLGRFPLIRGTGFK